MLNRSLEETRRKAPAPAVAVAAIVAALVAGSLAPRIAGAQEAESDGPRTMTQRVEVDARLADVWAAFTTKEGIESWMVPVIRGSWQILG